MPPKRKILMKIFWPRDVCRFLFLGSLAIVLALASNPAGAQREIYAGQVQSVQDGDTITILTDDYERVRVRFYGIDSPEKAQAYGPEAGAFLKSLIGSQKVRVEVVDVDRYSRAVGLVSLGGNSLNLAMVQAGLAWVYGQYCKIADFCRQLSAVEEQAKRAKLGLWADPDPVAPWDYRRSLRGGGNSSQLANPSPQGQNPSVSPSISSGPLRGNSGSMVFHNSSCRYYTCKNCINVFKSRAEAIKAGYKACRICGG
jgi:endonuclease YncB( thermonuclease family)